MCNNTEKRKWRFYITFGTSGLLVYLENHCQEYLFVLNQDFISMYVNINTFLKFAFQTKIMAFGGDS